MVFPVCHIVQGLEQVAVDHPHQIIKGRIRIRDTAEQRHLFLPDAPQVQFIGTGQVGDVRQVERCKAYSNRNKDTFRSLSRNELSRTF